MKRLWSERWVATALLALAAVAHAGEGAMSTINVSDLGATPNDGKDDTAAVCAALEQCRAQGAAGVVFPPGRYDFHAADDSHRHKVSMAAAGLRNAVIDGQGAELVFHGITQSFSFAGCEQLTVRNLTIDWEKPLITVGEIVASTPAYFDVKAYDEFPVQGGEKVDSFMDYDPETQLPRRHGMDGYWSVEKTELASPGVLRVFTVRPFDMKVGFLAVLRHQTYGFNAMSFHACKETTVEDVTVYHTPGMALTAGQCHNMSIRRFKVLIKPGTRRLISANADGSHFGGCTGKIVLEDCIFDGQGDDAINAKAGLYLGVTEKVDARTVLAKHNLNMRDPRDPGDVMELTPPDTLLPYGTATVASCEVLEDGQTHRLVFEKDLPERLAIGDLLGNASRCANFEIRNCTFTRNRARGILMQTRGAVVENCTFKDVTSGGIWVLAEVTHFFECIPARDVVIRNNTFEHCNYGGPLGDAVLGAFAYLKDFAPPPEPGVFRNVVIEGNTIDQADNCAIYLAGAENVVVKDNTITGAAAMPTRPHGRNAVYIRSSRNVAITGNRAEKSLQGEACESILAIGPGCDEGTIKVENNTGF